MTVRVGRLGYRIVTDPSIRVFSETPSTLSHLREQRLRWTRGFLHVLARNRSAIWARQGTRGLWTLPYALFNSFRRVIVIPLLVYAGVVAMVEPSALYLRDGAAVGAIAVGTAFLLTLGVLVAYRRFDLLPFVPAYLVLRLIRAYVALEMLFTLPLKTATVDGVSGHDVLSVTQDTPGGNGQTPEATRGPATAAAGSKGTDQGATPAQLPTE